ncbi:MAG: 50S ribosomal protein L9 [Porphyromonas sp.]|nr:50S ribosomal protein L9 [Bacteroidales bacterium]MDY3100741.1 50S ribosomal protein L9 [Porphyromonas sp.]
MKIILKEDISNLGFKNDIVEVRPGYGRNFLIPQGKAVIANETSLKVLAENMRQQERKLAKEKADAQALADKLEGAKANLLVKTSNTGTIYGSVTAAMVADNLEAQGFEVNRKMLQLQGGIKEIGEYVAKVRLHRDITVEVPVIVESENAAEIAAAKAQAKAEEAARQAEKERKLAAENADAEVEGAEEVEGEEGAAEASENAEA